MQTFTQFLEEKYDEMDNDSNNMNEAFENRLTNWFLNLDVEELIDYGDEYGNYVAYTTASDICDNITKATLLLHDKLKQK